MKKTTLIAGAVFAVLLVAVLLTREDNVNVGVPKLQLAALSGEVTQVELKDAKLTYESGAWKVNGFPADDGQVKGLTDALKDFRATDFVTEKTEKHAELEIDDAKGQKLVVSTAAGPQWSLVFGKMAKGGGMYVRDAKSNAVFTTTSPVGWQVKKKASEWRKKAIATAQYADVAKVTVTRPTSALTLKLEGEQWVMEPAPAAGFRYDPEGAKRLVQSATSLQAQDFGDALGEQQGTLELELKDGKKVTLKLGAKKPEGTVPLQVDGDPQVYLLAEWTAQNLLKGPEDLRDTTLLAQFEVEKANRLSITAGGKTTTLQKTGTEWKVTEPKKLPDGYELDPAQVSATLTRFRGTRATKAEPGVTAAAAGFAKPTARVEVGLEGGSKHAIEFGSETPADKNAVYVKGSADALTYSIGVPVRASLETGLEMFKKRAPPDMSQIRGLEQLPPEVRRQLEAQLKQQRPPN